MENSLAAPSLISSILLQLTSRNIVYGILAYLGFCVVHQIFYYRCIHPLKEFPGPFWASVTRLWETYHTVRGSELSTEWEWLKKNGPVMRISPTMLIVSDASMLPLIYHRTVSKSPSYSTGAVGGAESIFNMRLHKEHAYHRRILAGPYAFSKIAKAEPLVDALILAWINKLDSQFAETATPLDLSWWANYLTFDILTEIAFGKSVGCIEKGGDVDGLIQKIHDSWIPLTTVAKLYPFVEWIKKTWFKRYLVVTSESNNVAGKVMKFRDDLLNKRLQDLEEGPAKRVDLLQSLLNARMPDGQPLDIEWIKKEIFVVLFAGADTSGNAFGAIFASIFSSPSTTARLLGEISSAEAAGKLSRPVAKYNEIMQHLPFYIACIKEAMRLCPPGSANFGRLVDADQPPLIIGGKVVPVGTEIACNPWITGRDKKVYGEDAEAFRPERWLEDGEEAKLLEKYNFVFGYGSRTCIGKDLAMMDISKGALTLFRTFEITPCKPTAQTPAPKIINRAGVLGWENIWLTIKNRE